MKSAFRLFMLFMAVSLFEGCITIQVSPDASSAKAVRDDLYDSSIRTSSVNKKPKKSDYIDLDDESTFVEEEEEEVVQSPTFLNSRSVYQNNYNQGFSDGFRNGAFVSSPWNNWYSNPFLSFGISFGNRWASPLNSFNDPFFGGFSSPFSNFGFFGGFNSFNMGYMNPYNDPFLMNRMVLSSFFGGGFGGFGGIAWQFKNRITLYTESVLYGQYINTKREFIVNQNVTSLENKNAFSVLPLVPVALFLSVRF
jgi:hypothetical protein